MGKFTFIITGRVVFGEIRATLSVAVKPASIMDNAFSRIGFVQITLDREDWESWHFDTFGAEERTIILVGGDLVSC